MSYTQRVSYLSTSSLAQRYRYDLIQTDWSLAYPLRTLPEMPFDVATPSLSLSEDSWKLIISVQPKASSNSTPEPVASSSSVCNKDSNYPTLTTSPPPARPQTFNFDESPIKRNNNKILFNNNDLGEESDFLDGYDDKVRRKAAHTSLNRRLFIQADTSPASYALRSTSPERIFLPYSNKPLGPRELHENLVKEVLKDVAKSDKAGNVYVLTDSLSPGYCKVGRTVTTIRKRVADQGYKCGFDPTIPVDPYERETVFQLKLEKLVHTELAEYRRKEDLCRRGKGCNVKTHVEWVEIGVLVAFEVIERWRKWLELGVYVERKLDRTWVDKMELLVYVEGQRWADTWNDWMSQVTEY